MNKILVVFLLFLGFAQADSNLSEEVNLALQEMSSVETQVEAKKVAEAKALEEKKRAKAKALEEKKQKEFLKMQQRLAEAKKVLLRIDELLKKKKLLEESLSEKNIWASEYAPYESYQKFSTKLELLDKEIKTYKNRINLTEQETIKLKKIEEEYKIVSGKLEQLDEYKNEPFKEMIAPIKLEETPTISNPWDIITALSYQKHLKALKEKNDRKYASLTLAVEKIREKKSILETLSLLSDDKRYVRELVNTKKKLKDFELALAVFKTSVKTFSQKVNQFNLQIDKEIKKEIKKSIITGSIILFLLVLFFLIKILVRRYMSDNDLFYSVNKVVNFVFIFLIFIILLFSYLEDLQNLMTILSFASAGIAIALKDWFMSIMGWFVILISGSVHVGDRVKFIKNGKEYVGDIVDISVLRMTLHEDVTLTSVYTNRRTGRIIFIPNNYVFTDVIANYSHAGLKTVWDGIDIYLTFDSNIVKAQHIAKEVTRKYSKGYTDMTRKQLNKLRSKYSVRNTAVEPRIFGFADTYGIRLSSWYLTNAYATLTLRSTISMEILSRLQSEDDIFIALPSQSLYMNQTHERVPLKEGEEPTENHKTVE